MSTETEASPAIELGMREKRIASILLRFLSEVKKPMETIDFLSRIVAEDEQPIGGPGPAMALRSRCPNCHRLFDPACNEEGHSLEGETVVDPGSFYLCDLCGHGTKGREGKLLNNGMFVCNWCRHAEMIFEVYPNEVYPKEGDNVTD